MVGQGISHAGFASCRFIFKNQNFNFDTAVPERFTQGVGLILAGFEIFP
jgi:hypothetical protein